MSPLANTFPKFTALPALSCARYNRAVAAQLLQPPNAIHANFIGRKDCGSGSTKGLHSAYLIVEMQEAGVHSALLAAQIPDGDGLEPGDHLCPRLSWRNPNRHDHPKHH